MTDNQQALMRLLINAEDLAREIDEPRIRSLLRRCRLRLRMKQY